MKDSRALPSKGGLIGIILTLVALAGLGLAIWFTWQGATATVVQPAPQADPDPNVAPDLIAVPVGTNLGTFALGLLCAVLLVVVLYLAYQTRRYFALRYSLDRNAIKINLGDRQQVIPLANIRHLVPAQSVIDQMRGRVYSPAEAETHTSDEGGQAGPVKAYPRTRPTAQAETQAEAQAETVTEAEVSQFEPETSLPDDEFEEDEADNPSYQMTQTAAADSSLEDFEELEIQPAQLQNLDLDETDFDEADFQELEPEEGEVRAIEPATVRAIAIDFDESPRRQENGSADGGSNAKPENNGFATGGSVNFGVKNPVLSSWPGFYLNRASVASLGPVQFYSTQPLAKTLLVRTASQTYAISPREPQQFVREFQLRRKLGAIEPVEERVIPGQFLSHPLWHDKVGRGLILAGVVLNLLLYIYLIVRFYDLEPFLRMHFDKFGKVDRIEPRDQLMLLPFIGLLGVVGNSILGAFIQIKDRVPAYLLYGAAILLQILTAVAVFVILAVSGS